MDYAALVSFNLVAAHGGFSQASRATGRPKASLARHVRALEDELGVRLVERGVRVLQLTEEGAALRLRTEGLLVEVDLAVHDVAAGSSQPRGRLRVSAPVLFAHVAGGRLAAEFVARYPEVELEVVAEDRTVDLVAEGYDAVVRVDPRPEANLIGRCFLRDRHVVVAAPSLPRPLPSGGDAADREVPTVVLGGTPEIRPWRLPCEDGALVVRPRPVVRVSTLLMVRDAVRAGAGAAWLPRSLVADDLAAGRLVSWGDVSERDVELWVLHTSRRLVRPKVEAFVGFLCAAYAAPAA